MAAAEDELVAVPAPIEVEAVVGRGLLEARDTGRIETHLPFPIIFFNQATRMLTNCGSGFFASSSCARCARS